MPKYDAIWFDPPAPVARVVLRNPDSGITWHDVPMLIDSGADVTLIPAEAVERLALAVVPDKEYELLAFEGTVSFSQIAELELVFGRRTFRGQFLLAQQEWGIIGRNILNTVPLLLDGPHLNWQEWRG